MDSPLWIHHQPFSLLICLLLYNHLPRQLLPLSSCLEPLPRAFHLLGSSSTKTGVSPPLFLLTCAHLPIAFYPMPEFKLRAPKPPRAKPQPPQQSPSFIQDSIDSTLSCRPSTPVHMLKMPNPAIIVGDLWQFLQHPGYSSSDAWRSLHLGPRYAALQYSTRESRARSISSQNTGSI